MVNIEVLSEEAKQKLPVIKRDDIPISFVESVEDTIRLSEYGTEQGLKGACYAVKYDEQYVGILLVGEAIPGEEDPAELEGKRYFRILGFILDKDYRGKGIGSQALKLALEDTYRNYGDVAVLLECHKENEQGLRFYLRNGFRNTGILNRNDYFLIRDSLL